MKEYIKPVVEVVDMSVEESIAMGVGSTPEGWD